MEELSFKQAFLTILIVLVFIVLLTLKIGGSSSLPVLVEKDGYCKTLYGTAWKYSEKDSVCYNRANQSEPRINFTQEQFRDVCLKNSFLSTRFYSDCFHKGDARNNP